MLMPALRETEQRLLYASVYGSSEALEGTLRDLDDRSRDCYLLKILDLGLEERLTAKVGLLSGGQRQALTLLMATLKKPKLLLLDEHTAALDPKTAKKVLDITEEIVAKDNLMTIMITHNMADAIRVGNRLIMMHEGRVVVDVKGEEKKKLTIEQLLQMFEASSGAQMTNDKVMLSK
jgi:putative ABC transport system ATP-binding protein